MDVSLSDLEKHEEFLELVKEGVGELNAAITVGWTPAKLRKLRKDPDFVQLIEECRTRLLEDVEQTEYALAKRGNQRAIEMVLFCHGAERGWHPPTQRVSIERTDTVKIELVQATVEAARQLLGETGAVAALQAGVIDTTATDDDD